MTKPSMLVTLALLSASLTVVHPAPAQAAYPGENGRILFSGDGGFGTWDIHTMNPDGTDIVNLTPGAFTAEHATWSPDGTRIAFSEVVGSPSGCAVGDIYVMNADGSDITPLTTSEFGVTAFDPTWSPDGTEIAFTRGQNDSACSGADLDIWKMNSDGSGQVLLTAGTNNSGPAADQEPTWSPDGDRIAFRSNRHTSDWSDGDQIWTMDPDGSNVTQVTHRPDGTLERNNSPAWSPDGEQIAYRHFLHRPPTGLAPTQIWRINEDGTGATAVTTNGFGGNMNPAWSPDGQQIIFTAAFEEPAGTFNNDIFSINVDGTGQTNITNTGVAKDRADWQPLIADPPPPPPTVENGRIIVAGEGGTGTVDLITMNPDGSDRVNLTPGGSDEQFPEWSPDGTKIAFSRTADSPSGCRTGDVYVMNADGSDITPLTSNESGVAAYDPTWSPDGTEIAFTREHYDSTCTSGDVDIWKMNSDGTGQVLLTAGANEFGPALDSQPTWSPDGDRIAFHSDRASADWAFSEQIWTMDPDGSNVTQVTHQDFETFESNKEPAWSPDGEQIAYQHFPHNPAGGEAVAQIWRINEDGTGETAVTSNGFLINMTPEWSPDGQRILFNTHFEDPPGEFNNDIFMINPDGTEQTNVTNTGTALFSVDWQPLLPPPPPDPGANGRIAFVSTGPEGSFTEDIWTMNPDGSDRVNLLPGDVSEFYPEWSPDGTKIAFSRSHGSPSGCETGDIWIMDADGSNVTQVTTNPFGVHAFDPTWSPDGEQLAFTRIDWGGDCNSTVSSGIWTMNVDGTNQTFISSDHDDADPDWSPLGDKIAFMSIRPNQDGNSYLEIYTMNTDGSQVTKLTDTPSFTDPEFNERPAWSPDGSMIAFEHFFGITDVGPEIWIMDANGGNERTVTENGFVSNIHATWSPDGQQIAFAGFEQFGEGENNDIYTINVDGSNQTQITDNATNNWYPTWQPLVDPVPPVLEPPALTATDPASPANDNNPRVIGTAPGAATVTLYTTDDCSGVPAVSGTNDDFTSTGLPVTVPDNSTTTFHATATDADGNASACSSSSITYVEDSTPVDVVVTDCDDPELAELTTVSGNLIIQNVEGCDAINLASLVEVAGDLIITGNADATVINLSALTTVGGNLEISGNPSAGELNLGSLGAVSGNLVVTDNAGATTINVAALATVGGNLEISNNQGAGELNLQSLVTVSGNLEITGNTGAETINLSALAETSGNLLISNNTSAGDLSLPALEHVGGAVGMSGNTATGAVNLSSLATVTGDLVIIGNGAAGEVDISSLSEAGSVEITGNGAAEVSANLDSVHGDVDIESTGDGTFDPGSASAGGDTDLDTDGYDAVSGATAGGTTDIENTRPEATLHVQLPDGAFDAAVGFTITRLAPATLTSIEGIGADDEAASIDPVAAYQFDFDVPTLNAEATLTFDILLDGLDEETRATLLEALDAGTATMATRGDAPDAIYQAFPVCTGEQVPTADGCVLIETLDAEGNPTTDTPAIVRFSNVVGHFSTWAVVTTEAVVEEPTEEPTTEPTTQPTTQPTQPPVSPPPPPGDTTLPTIAVPDDIVVKARTLAGTAVTFEAVATDDVDGTSPADCDPASGSVFPVGDNGLATVTTTVTCTKTDAAGNEATPETFTVTVIGALDQLASLRTRIDDSQVSEQLRRDLSRKVRLTLKKLRTTPPDLEGACSTLRAFVRKVERHVGSARLNRFVARRWIRTVRRVRTVIGC